MLKMNNMLLRKVCYFIFAKEAFLCYGKYFFKKTWGRTLGAYYLPTPYPILLFHACYILLLRRKCCSPMVFFVFCLNDPGKKRNHCRNSTYESLSFDYNNGTLCLLDFSTPISFNFFH